MRPLNLTNEVRRQTRKENPMPYRLIAALCLCLLGLQQQARAESCASILARAEYPQGRDITATVPLTMVTPGSSGEWGSARAELSRHRFSSYNTFRIPDDAPGPVDLVFRLTQDLPEIGRQQFKTDIPGVGLTVRDAYLGMRMRVKPGEELGRDIDFVVERISDDLVPGILDLSRLPGIQLECAEEQAAPAWVMRLAGSLNIQTPTCEVQQEQVVDMGEHTVSSLDEKVAPWVDFSLRLSNCAPFYGRPHTLYFDGETHDVGYGGNSYITVRVQTDAYGAYGSSAMIRLDATPSFEWWLHPLLIELQISTDYGSWWGDEVRHPATDRAEYNIPMRARYYRMNPRVPLEPGPKNASAVLLIRYE